eukprot:Seg246.14 transcript_id=Seg246.14/GoldUCD/mRNA.D3Y31 product="hypothetical protein" protein_id=Seg246.14/GoldUCD/D3Y31
MSRERNLGTLELVYCPTVMYLATGIADKDFNATWVKKDVKREEPGDARTLALSYIDVPCYRPLQKKTSMQLGSRKTSREMNLGTLEILHSPTVMYLATGIADKDFNATWVKKDVKREEPGDARTRVLSYSDVPCYRHCRQRLQCNLGQKRRQERGTWGR